MIFYSIRNTLGSIFSSQSSPCLRDDFLPEIHAMIYAVNSVLSHGSPSDFPIALAARDHGSQSSIEIFRTDDNHTLMRLLARYSSIIARPGDVLHSQHMFSNLVSANAYLERALLDGTLLDPIQTQKFEDFLEINHNGSIRNFFVESRGTWDAFMKNRVSAMELHQG